MSKKHISLLISIILTMFIFSMSLFPGSSSGDLSSGFTTQIKNVLDSIFINNRISIDLLHTIIRKGAHVFEYFVLGISYFFTAKAFRLSILKLLVIGLTTAGVDELIQKFVPERAGRIMDVLIFDFGGFVLGLCLMLLLFDRSRKDSKQSILEDLEENKISPKKAYKYIYKYKNILLWTNKAHFIKFKIHTKEGKSVNRFLRLIFFIPLPILLVKFILLFIKDNKMIFNDIPKEEIRRIIQAKGFSVNVHTASGEIVTIKTI